MTGEGPLSPDELHAFESERAAHLKAIPTTVDGHTFHSRAEAGRYRQLRRRAVAGEITKLVVQPVYRLEVAGVYITTYHADFRYYDVADRRWVVEDVKGPAGESVVWIIKRNLMHACFGIRVRVIDADDCYGV